MALEFTPGQARAIETRGGSLLVSAAAGSGKTRVLVERLMRYVTDPEDPRDIDSFLIITYTRAAASQLKSRVSGALAALAAERPSDARLRRQQNLSYRAQIGTIHSFCAALLRENCQYLGLPPGFSVLEGDRERVLRQSVLERVLDARYEKMDAHPGFEQLVDTVGAGRDDSRLAALVPELWQKLRSHPYPEDWARRQLDALALEGVSDAGQTPWGRELLDAALASAKYWLARTDAAAGEIRASGDVKLQKAYLPAFEDDCLVLGGLIAALGEGWDAAARRLPLSFKRLNPLRQCDSPELAAGAKALRALCKKAAEGWAASLSGTSDALLAEQRAMAPASRALLELTLDFDRAFAAEKKRRGCVDFSDLEHMAAQLLVDRASGRPTWIAVETMQRYTEIMVDEYQDVNAVQELIFTALARPGGNLFLVGDVKQSIYRFRLADPSIFLRKSRDWPDADAAVAADGGRPGGRRILLRENFRSRRGVLRAVNHVFSNIMSRELGELDYDASASLRYGAVGYPDGGDDAVELDIIDPSGDGRPQDAPEKSEAEARFVAERIRELVASGAPVFENGAPRRCGYGDFALLLRSPSANGAVFRRVLASAGIPVQARQGGGFFQSLEVTTALNLLGAVDNPHADVPLISVLRSPAFAFSPDELAAVRAGTRGGDFYCALRAAGEGGDEKCAGFLRLLDGLRAAAPELGVCRLLRRIYDETDLLALCSAMNSPQQRRGNLTRLFELAQEFENGGESGILRFTQKLRRMAERGEEPPAGAEADCVRIMSIHKSKGLEFPFVFLCDLSHGFNRSDLSQAVLLHTDLGLGPKLTDAARGIEYPTLARRAIAGRLTRESLSEEMRVLYVGMTRARERLFMTCTAARALKSALELPEGGPGPVAPELLQSDACFARWLAAAARVGDGGGIALRLVAPGGDAAEASACAPAPEPGPEPDGELYARLCARLDWRYPFRQAAELPSKLTATGLKGRADDAERLEDAVLAPSVAAGAAPAAADAADAAPDGAPAFRRAQFGAGAPKASAAERGTATHALLQRMDLSLAADGAGARAELERLRRRGILTSEQADAVDIRAVTRFGKSALCRRMLRADELRREFRFTLLAEAADYFDGAPAGERLLLQGVVDCFIVEDGGVTVIDYKTDRVSAAEAPARARSYAAQLDTYARALERIRALPVREKLVYFLTPGVCVSV